MGKWFGKDEVEVPKELEGLTPEQIIAAAKEAQELKTKISEIDTLKAKIADMEANPKTVEKIVEKVVDRRAAPQNDPPARTSFLDDEDKAFGERAKPIVDGVFAIGAQVSRMSFENGLDGLDKKMYAKYGKEVEEMMAKEPANNQASPYAWRTIFDIIKGRHTNDILKAQSEKTDFFAAEASGSPDAGPQKNTDPMVLTEDEKAIAKKYGMDEKAYAENKKGMVIYHG